MIDLDQLPIIVRVGTSANLPPGDVTPAEWSEYKARVVAQENKALDDLTDVDTTGVGDGDALVYDDGEWKPGTAGGTLAMVEGYGEELIATDVSRLLFGNGLTVHESPTVAGRAIVNVVTGTTANVPAVGNHTHAIRVDTQLTFNASGSFSSGTRTLVAGNVTGLDTTKTYVLKGVLDVHLRGDGAGAGYTRPRITINGNAVDMPERPRNVVGVQPCYTMRHPGVTVSGVSSVAVSATIAYSEGDATWVGGGALTISIEANR